MVSNSVPILIVFPGAFGLAPRYFCQNSWLTMTDDGAPGRISSSTNARPSSGLTPNTVKKSRDTDVERTRTGSLSPLTVTMLAGDVITIARETARLCLHVGEVRFSEAVTLAVLAGLKELNDAIGVRIWQRLQEHAVHDAEDRRRRTDAERQRERRDDEKARTSRERACDVAEISQQRIHGSPFVFE